MECQLKVWIQHQQESSIWGAVKKATLFSANSMAVKTAQVLGGPGARWPFCGSIGLLSPAQVCSALVRHPLCFIFSVSAPAWEMHSSVFGGKTKCTLRGELTYIDRSCYPWSLFGPFSCKWRLQIPVVWSVQKALFGLVRMELLWFVVEDAAEDMAAQLQLDGEIFSPIGWNGIPETLL